MLLLEMGVFFSDIASDQLLRVFMTVDFCIFILHHAIFLNSFIVFFSCSIESLVFQMSRDALCRCVGGSVLPLQALCL